MKVKKIYNYNRTGLIRVKFAILPPPKLYDVKNYVLAECTLNVYETKVTCF